MIEIEKNIELETGCVLGKLGEALSSLGYGEFLTSFNPLAPRPRQWELYRDCAPSQLKCLIDLFLLNKPVHVDLIPISVRRLVPDLLKVGILQQQEKQVVMTSGLSILLVFGSWLICQPSQVNPSHYFGDDSVGLLTRLVPKTGGRHLDLCAGPGIHSMYVARFATHVTAVELDPLSATLARLNASLNRISKIDVRQGDLFAPIAGMQFDSVTVNPPLLPYPKCLPPPAIGDGGEDGLEITWRVLDRLPVVLTDGGHAQLVGMTFSDGQLPLCVDQMKEIARAHNLNVHLTIIKSMDKNSEIFNLVLEKIAAVSKEPVHIVRDSYEELMLSTGASHLCTFYLRIDKQDGELFNIFDMAKQPDQGFWHI